MRSIVLLAVVALSVAACKKEDSKTSTDNAAKLRGNWKLSASKRTSFFYITQRDTTENWFPEIPDCYKDDVLKLNEGFNGEVFYGAKSCTPAEQQTALITWQVMQNDTVLEINNARQLFFGADPMRGQLVGDVGNTFTVRYKNNEVDSFLRPEVVTYENTYTRQ